MQIRPEQWTHHHTHRLFHISIGLCFAFVVLTIAIGMVAIWLRAYADTSPKTELVQVTAMVSGISPGPITPGGGSNPAPQANQIPAISIFPDPNNQPPQRLVVIGKQTVKAFVFSVPNPVFFGKTSVPNSLIFLTVQGPQNLNSTALANSQGNWSWQPPYDLVPGLYLLTVSSYDLRDFSIYSTARHAVTKTYFIIEPQPAAAPAPSGLNTVDSPGISAVPPGAESRLFGVFFEVIRDYRRVTAGHKVVGAITLVSNFPDKGVEDQLIEYQVKALDGTVIMESKDLVSFSKVSQFLKTILTAPGTQPGVYAVVVTSTFNGILSTASDNFVVEPALPALIESPAVNGPIILWSASVGLLILFLLLVFAAYYQIRVVSRHINEHNDRWHVKKEL